ncbi:MAG: TonB-dependent receptor [Cytophagia bacterium]|nr:TonB-dependent receptor [Cytophagia bacterium]
MMIKDVIYMTFFKYVLSFTNFWKVSKAKGHKKWLLLLLSVNWITPVESFGQKNNPDTLANVVVSASRQQISNLKTPYSVSVLQQKDIENLALRATPDMLSNIPGVFIQKTNLGGGSAFVRGLTGNQTLLIIDGIRFNNSTFRYGPNQYLNTIDPSIISKVELLKGSGSVQYGSDALTGVVNFFTLQPEFTAQKTFGGQLSARVATEGMELSEQFKMTYSSENTGIVFVGANKQFGDVVRGGGLGLQRPTGYNEWDYFGKIRQQLSKTWVLEGLIQTTQQTQVPVFHKIQLENFKINEMDLQKYQRGYLKAIGQYENPIFKKIELSVSQQTSIEQRKLQKNASTTLRAERDEITTLGILADVQSQFSSTWSAHSGIDYFNDRINSAREDINLTNNSIKALRGLYPNNAGYQYQSAYSIHHLDLDAWQIETGLRFHQNVASLPDTTLGLTQVKSSALVYSLGVARAISQGISVYANTSSGFRAPNMDDLGSLGIVDFRYELPAFDLKPEYSQNYEVGIKISKAKFFQELTIFQTELENLITRIKTSNVIQTYPVYEKRNVDKAFLRGGEWSGRYELSNSVSAKANISYVYGQSVTLNEPMRRIPPLHGGFSLSYARKNLFINSELLFAAAQDRLSAGDKADNRMNPLGTPGWAIINVQANYLFNSHLSISLQAQNIGDVDYRMHGSGINGLGRSLWGQIHLKF